jgi:hypothetical protein
MKPRGIVVALGTVIVGAGALLVTREAGWWGDRAHASDREKHDPAVEDTAENRHAFATEFSRAMREASPGTRVRVDDARFLIE